MELIGFSWRKKNSILITTTEDNHQKAHLLCAMMNNKKLFLVVNVTHHVEHVDLMIGLTLMMIVSIAKMVLRLMLFTLTEQDTAGAKHLMMILHLMMVQHLMVVLLMEIQFNINSLSTRMKLDHGRYLLPGMRLIKLGIS